MFKRTPSIESPERIEAFLNTTKSLTFDAENKNNSLDSVFDEANKLITHEVKYYYKSRVRERRSSFWFRLTILAFGGTGFLCPLLENAGYKGVGNYGFLSFGIAGLFIAANNLFGATSGHIRYITTQLQLEKLIAETKIGWLEHKAKRSASQPTEKETEQAFKIIKDYLAAAHKLILDETNQWGDTLQKALNEYAKKMKA